MCTRIFVIWVELDRLELEAGNRPLWLNPRDETLVGEVADRLAPRSLPFGV